MHMLSSLVTSSWKEVHISCNLCPAGISKGNHGTRHALRTTTCKGRALLRHRTPPAFAAMQPSLCATWPCKCTWCCSASTCNMDLKRIQTGGSYMPIRCASPMPAHHVYYKVCSELVLSIVVQLRCVPHLFAGFRCKPIFQKGPRVTVFGRSKCPPNTRLWSAATAYGARTGAGQFAAVGWRRELPANVRRQGARANSVRILTVFYFSFPLLSAPASRRLVGSRHGRCPRSKAARASCSVPRGLRGGGCRGAAGLLRPPVAAAAACCTATESILHQRRAHATVAAARMAGGAR